MLQCGYSFFCFSFFTPHLEFSYLCFFSLFSIIFCVLYTFLKQHCYISIILCVCVFVSSWLSLPFVVVCMPTGQIRKIGLNFHKSRSNRQPEIFLRSSGVAWTTTQRKKWYIRDGKAFIIIHIEFSCLVFNFNVYFFALYTHNTSDTQTNELTLVLLLLLLCANNIPFLFQISCFCCCCLIHIVYVYFTHAYFYICVPYVMYGCMQWGCSISHKTFLILQIEECKINYTQNLYIYVYKLCGFKRNALSLGGAYERVCAEARVYIRLSTVSVSVSVSVVIEFESLMLQYKLCIGLLVWLVFSVRAVFSSQSQTKNGMNMVEWHQQTYAFTIYMELFSR